MSSVQKRTSREQPSRVAKRMKTSETVKVSKLKTKQKGKGGHGHSHGDGHSHDHGHGHGHDHGGHTGHGQDDDDVDYAELDAAGWSKYYDSEAAKADHDDLVHECLAKYKSRILSENSGLKILMPLCGQVFDMKYLAELGHSITGVEFAESAVKNFFERYKIPVKITNQPKMKGKLYSSTDKERQIKIYCCDVYDFKSPEIEYDAIWDSGAMHSLPKKDLQKYIDALKPLLKKGCSWLVDFTVPSCSGDDVGKKDLEKILKKGYTVEDLGITKTKREAFLKWETEGFQVFHITRK